MLFFSAFLLQKLQKIETKRTVVNATILSNEEMGKPSNQKDCQWER